MKKWPNLTVSADLQQLRSFVKRIETAGIGAVSVPLQTRNENDRKKPVICVKTVLYCLTAH